MKGFIKFNGKSKPNLYNFEKLLEIPPGHPSASANGPRHGAASPLQPPAGAPSRQLPFDLTHSKRELVMLLNATLLQNFLAKSFTRIWVSPISISSCIYPATGALILDPSSQASHSNRSRKGKERGRKEFENWEHQAKLKCSICFHKNFNYFVEISFSAFSSTFWKFTVNYFAPKVRDFVKNLER